MLTTSEAIAEQSCDGYACSLRVMCIPRRTPTDRSWWRSPSHRFLSKASMPSRLDETRVGFLVGPPYMHWSKETRTELVRRSHSTTSSVSHIDGSGSTPGSSGCSNRWQPPRDEQPSIRARQLTVSTSASSTRSCSAAERPGRPQAYSPLVRTGRGPGVGKKRALDHVAHGGPPRTASTRPSSTASDSLWKVRGPRCPSRGPSPSPPL